MLPLVYFTVGRLPGHSIRIVKEDAVLPTQGCSGESAALHQQGPAALSAHLVSP